MTCTVNAISEPDAISWYKQGNYVPDQPAKAKYEVSEVYFNTWDLDISPHGLLS